MPGPHKDILGKDCGKAFSDLLLMKGFTESPGNFQASFAFHAHSVHAFIESFERIEDESTALMML